MAELGQTFDPNAVEPGQFDDVPAGEYAAQIVDSEVKPTKAGAGLGLNLTWQITEGPLENHKFWQWINFQHESQQAQTIGQQQLKAICDAIGYTDHVTDSEVLHNVVCRVKLGMGKANGNYAAKPEVKSVKPYAAQPPGDKPQVQQQKPAPQVQQTKLGGQPVKPSPGKPAAGPAGTRPWTSKPAA
jgi:hypothetical protein